MSFGHSSGETQALLRHCRAWTSDAHEATKDRAVTVVVGSGGWSGSFCFPRIFRGKEFDDVNLMMILLLHTAVYVFLFLGVDLFVYGCF